MQNIAARTEYRRLRNRQRFLTRNAVLVCVFLSAADPAPPVRECAFCNNVPRSPAGLHNALKRKDFQKTSKEDAPK
jgi:hypothetical protein